MHTSFCFKIVNKCNISKYVTFKFKDFQGFSSTFKHLICFQALSRALKFLFQIQALSRISQARYDTKTGSIAVVLPVILPTADQFSKFKMVNCKIISVAAPLPFLSHPSLSRPYLSVISPSPLPLFPSTFCPSHPYIQRPGMSHGSGERSKRLCQVADTQTGRQSNQPADKDHRLVE